MDGEAYDAGPKSDGLDAEFQKAMGDEAGADVTPVQATAVNEGKRISSADFMATVWPVMEDQLVAQGGAHWRLKDGERQCWLSLMEMAYPEFDPGRLAKPAFWLVTAAIFGPRLFLSIGQAFAIARGRDARPTAERDNNDPGEEGEREDDLE
jgi:hypothetical protein